MTTPVSIVLARTHTSFGPRKGTSAVEWSMDIQIPHEHLPLLLSEGVGIFPDLYASVGKDATKVIFMFRDHMQTEIDIGPTMISIFIDDFAYCVRIKLSEDEARTVTHPIWLTQDRVTIKGRIERNDTQQLWVMFDRKA